MFYFDFQFRQVPHLEQTSPLQNWVESRARKVYESWEHENNQIQPFMPVFVKPSKLHSWETHIHGRIIELAESVFIVPIQIDENCIAKPSELTCRQGFSNTVQWVNKGVL